MLKLAHISYNAYSFTKCKKKKKEWGATLNLSPFGILSFYYIMVVYKTCD